MAVSRRGEVCAFLPFLGGDSLEGLEGLLRCPRWGAFEKPWALRFTGAAADLGPPERDDGRASPAFRPYRPGLSEGPLGHVGME